MATIYEVSTLARVWLATVSRVMNGIEGELRKRRKHVVITAGHGRKADEVEGIEFLKSHNCDAIVVHAERLSDDYLIELSKGSTSIYILNRYIPSIAHRCISLDNLYGGYLATRHVLQQGHRSLVNISGPHYKIDSAKRIEGFHKAIGEYGLTLHKKAIYEGDYMHEGGMAAVDYFMHNNTPFTAMVCGNDQMAIGAMARLREYKKIPGQDVAIIGFDDTASAACTFPRLSTIKYPIKEMGKTAANMILHEVYKVNMASILSVFEPTLIVRDSVQANT